MGESGHRLIRILEASANCHGDRGWGGLGIWRFEGLGDERGGDGLVGKR